jgi:ATP-dependent Lon protease
VPCDLSWVSWIATVNEIGQLPKPLLERFTVVLVLAPGEEHFNTLVNGVLNSFAKELGLDTRMLPALDNSDLDVLRMCSGPREISRTARMMVEMKLVNDRRKMMRN